MKKFLALILVLALVLSSMVGCGAKKEEAASTTAAEPELTVGFIYIGPANDGGFSEAHDNGRKAMEEYFKGKVKTLTAENVAERQAGC